MVPVVVGTTERRTLFEVEREKRWRIWLLFALLLGLAFVTVWVGCVLVTVFAYLVVPLAGMTSWVFTLRGIAVILGVALGASLLYWGAAQIGARGRLLKAMHCRPLDPGDRYHARLADIVEEMRLASGAPRLECVTVRTVGLNAFAFSDLHGGGVIGVTEGALARLSRQQLEAVVAQELAYVLSGSCVTVTVSCLLFGIYSALGDDLDQAVDATADTRAVSGLIVMVPLRTWLWVMQLASSVVGAALSRQRELQADLAAVRYTRDPLSLAEALRIVGRHPGGAGYIPQGLAPLCLRATGTPGWPAVSWRDGHRPLEERIATLLGVANVSAQEFERQAEQAGDHFGEREHWAPGPAAGAAGRPAGAAIGALPGDVAPARPAGLAAGTRPAAAGTMACPSCGAGLTTAPYEGVDITVCTVCGGRLVTGAQVGKLLARREVAFTEQQQRLADVVADAGDRLRRAAVLARGQHGIPLIACPHCAAPMMRRHYSYDHAVEIDYCSRCDLFWFERDELEVLQLLVERQTG
jgi:Zn-dependent protease with chaperone function/Zn-finger nucleic acid-binding protein